MAEGKAEKQETLEELFAKLDTIAEKLEEGETSLEDSFQLYQTGMELLKQCNDKIDTVSYTHLTLPTIA